MSTLVFMESTLKYRSSLFKSNLLARFQYIIDFSGWRLRIIKYHIFTNRRDGVVGRSRGSEKPEALLSIELSPREML